jgi:rod shape-determining protein MreC
MRTILRFIYKQHNLILFLLIEIFCLAITIKNNDYQNAVGFSIIEEFSGSIHKIYHSVYRFINTVDENKKLAHENAFLKAKLLNIANINENNIIYKDTYDLIPTNIVFANVFSSNNYIIINKGKNDSIEADMGVICPTGVVGIVKNVSPNFATVIPIINVNAHISARIKTNQYFGTTNWDGKDFKYINLADIPYHVKLKKGDTVITSGFSTIFPEGIEIGIIENFDFNEGNDFYNIVVRLSTEFNKINHVYVVRHKKKNEFKQIENEIKNVR